MPGDGYRLLVAGALWICLAAAGGASRADEDRQALARLAAILAVAASLWPLDFEPLRRHARVLLFVAGAWLLLLIQLVPLPPGLWSALPGHAPYWAIAEAAGNNGWRPLSLTPDRTLNALMALLPATAAGLAMLWLDSRGRLRVAEAIIALACISGLIGLAELAVGEGFRLYPQNSPDSGLGLFANRNHQAALMACALAVTGAVAGVRLSEGANRRLGLAVTLGVAGLLLASLASTGSRMGLALGVVGMIGAGCAFGASGRKLWPAAAPARLAATGGGLLASGLVALLALRSGALERLTSADIVTDTRVAMVRPLLRAASAFMPVGAGFGSFESVYQRFEPTALLSTIEMNQAHDEPMQLAIEGGAVALALLAGFLGWWLVAGARAVRQGQPPRRRAMAVGALAVTVILLLSSLVDYPLRTPMLGAVFAVACVELIAAGARPRPRGGLNPSPREAHQRLSNRGDMNG